MLSKINFLKPHEDIIDNLIVRTVLLADGRYPLCEWLMKLYSLTPAFSNIEKKFNKKRLSSRAVVERSFGICKARWRCLLKRLVNSGICFGCYYYLFCTT